MVLLEDYLEVVAAISFKDQFREVYGENGPTFNICRLDEAIAESCRVHVQSRKILGLYFHNQNDPFSKKFCSSIMDDEIKFFLKKSFFILGWNIADQSFHPSLIRALNAHLELSELTAMITNHRAAFIAVFPTDNALNLFSAVYGSVESHDILLTLKNCHCWFNSVIDNEQQLKALSVKSEDQVGSEEIQQIMCERLGDRDYESFEPDQHEYLKQKIGFAKFGQPSQESGYDEKKQKLIDKTYEQICKHSNMYSEYQNQIIISFIYNCLEPLSEDKLTKAKKNKNYNPHTDVLPIPVFVIRKCFGSNNPCRIFIDNDNRVYNSWQEYIMDNEHHKCQMVVPQNGRYMKDKADLVILETYLSPSCGIKRKLLRATDIGTSVAGTASTAIILTSLIPAVTVTPIVLAATAGVGIGIGIISIVRGAFNLHDRRIHGESISLANSTARATYFNIVAGALGFVGMGATNAVSILAARGVNITKGAQWTVNTINVCTITASGVSVCNSSYDMVNDWIVEQQKPSALAILQLSSSILFFANATCNFKLAGTLTKEAQVASLRQYEESLRSNRHRKTFNKLLKETIRLIEGEQSTAYAEVISACHKIPDKDTVFAILTRHNQILNKEGIRFSAEGGAIKFNGVAVDLIEFGSMSQLQKSQFLTDMSAITPIDLKSVTTASTSSNIDIILPNNTNTEVFIGKYSTLITNGFTLIQKISQLLVEFAPIIQQKLYIILQAVLDELINMLPDLDIVFKKYLPGSISEPVLLVERLVLEQLKQYAAEHYPLTLQKLNTKEAINHIVNIVVTPRGIHPKYLQELIQYVVNALTQKIVDYCSAKEAEQKRIKSNPRTCVSCTSCGGKKFSATPLKL